MKCAAHPDRSALGYCSRCGKALCKDCLVRLSAGNFCEACANDPQGRMSRPKRRFPWWTIALIVMGVAAAASILRSVIH